MADKQVDDTIGQSRQRHIGLSHCLDRSDQRRQHCSDQLLKQALLVTEVEVDRAFGDAGAARHIFQASGLETAAGKFVEGGGRLFRGVPRCVPIVVDLPLHRA